MKTPVWSPKKLSLTCRTASPKSVNGKTTTSGANASFEQTWASTGTFSRTVGSKNAPSALPPTTTLPPSWTASSTQRWVRAAAWPSSTIGPTSVTGSIGSPRWSALTPVDELLEERLADVLVEEHALDADAHLAGVGERPDERSA